MVGGSGIDSLRMGAGCHGNKPPDSRAGTLSPTSGKAVTANGQ